MFDGTLHFTPMRTPRRRKRCNFAGCGKSAQGTSNKCITHGGGRRCDVTGCVNSAVGTSNKCKRHGGGNRCLNCIDWPDSRSAKSVYDGYCATCFKRVFPDDPRSQRVYSHTKELMVRNMINANFDGFTHDTALYTGNCNCTHRRRIDHRKLIGNTMLAVETDEFAHRSYDAADEELRYDDLFMIFSGKWEWIRFNPDGKSVDIEDKLDVLRATIQTTIERIEAGLWLCHSSASDVNTDLVRIVKLYY